MKLRHFTPLWNLWPPFLGLGIKIRNISKDFKHVDVVLKKRPWNVNYFGTQYGGGIFAMTDGIHMLMLIQHLPKSFRIWDKAAEINYIKRGETELHAHFEISDEDIREIQMAVRQKGEYVWCKNVEIKDKNNQLIALVRRDIFIKDKNLT